MTCVICGYRLPKAERGRRRKYCSFQCSKKAAARRQYAKYVEARVARLAGKAKQPKPKAWTSARDIPAREIERRFAAAKQRVRWARQQESEP